MIRNVKTAWAGLAVLAMAVGAVVPAVAGLYSQSGSGGSGPGGMMGRDYMMGSGLWHGVGALVWLIIVGLIIAGVVLLIRRLWDIGGGSQGDARALLDARYAKGEIDEEEYQRRKKTLLG